MKDTQDKKMYCFVDESGDPVFFNKKGKDLVQSGESSSIFIVGFVEIANPSAVNKIFAQLHNEIISDEYLQGIPSLGKTKKHFHAKDDCPEVREKVFRTLKELEMKAFVIVARKNVDQFRKKFKGKPKEFYAYLVEKVFENRLHLNSELDIYFSKMGNTVRERNMKEAIEKAMLTFEEKWKKENNSNIRIMIQEPSQHYCLQVIDYLIWAIYRVYTKQDTRYFRFLSDKYSMIIDIFDSGKYPKNYYTKNNPLDITKISPLNS